MTNFFWDRVKLIAAGTAIGGLGIAYAIFGKDDIDPRWGGLAVETVILFGYLAAGNRSLWKTLRFWQSMILLFAVHCTAFIFILFRVSRFPLILFVVPAVLEFLAFQFVLDRLCPSTPRK